MKFVEQALVAGILVLGLAAYLPAIESISRPGIEEIVSTDTGEEQENLDTSTATIHPDKGSADEAPEEGLAAGDDMEHTVAGAEMLYRQAVASYAGGNTARARRLYSASLHVLASAGIDPQLQYQLCEDFDNLFEKLKYMDASSGKTADRYSIPLDVDNELVQKYLKIFGSGSAREELQRALERGSRYRDMILRIIREYDLPDELVYLPVIESLYDNDCQSTAGALGIWQLMPERARHLGLKVNYWIDERKDPEKATRAACRYLKSLYQMFDDWHLALAAYNRGEYGLAHDLEASRSTDLRQVSGRKAVPRETECFVPRFIACALIADNPGRYGLNVRQQIPLAYDRVIVNSIIDLKIIARCSNATIGEIRRLNPALKAWCTPRNYAGFELHLPSGTSDHFLAAIARVDDLNPHQGYIKYRVTRGDCLDVIARRFQTTVTEIRRANNLPRADCLRINQVLVIRPGRQYMAGMQD